MKITLDSNPSDAPCCVKIIAQDGRDQLIQTDWDFPSIASTFGFSLVSVQPSGREFGSEDTDRPPCQHSGTDGTVDCKDCACTATQFISAARQWLDDNDGAEAEDPGYF
jgi:hypothetical protein